MFKMFLTTLVLTVFTFADAPLLKTGQTISYDTYGNVVTDGSVKDDGYYQMGKARSYSRSAVGVVKDNVTGLAWQDDTEAKTVMKNWDEAGLSCADLLLEGGGWRLPTILELQSIVVDGVYNPNIDTTVFVNYATTDNYWSSTTYAGSGSYAWLVNFYDGYTDSYNKTSIRYVRCVRGVSIPPSTFTRDDANGIVTDNQTHLQWQDDYSDNGEAVKYASWTDAIGYCEALSLDGVEWRLPNKKELLSIVDYSVVNPSISSVFQKKASDGYWSSTSYAVSAGAWYVHFNYGNASNNNKTTYSYYVRCVRGGQFDTSVSLAPVIMYILD